MTCKQPLFFMVVLVTVTLSNFTAGQVTTGIPPFQSFDGGPDVIKLGNLNVHYSLPVFGRSGRGIPFNYALAYDSSVWKVAGSAWLPASTSWGLTRDIALKHNAKRMMGQPEVHCC